ncbi:MAG: aminotransferase class I/II-fold pyridoxal phosphate-dependent enzyme, partial [Duncaniella sp.]|nr:aminotransferase class I/II-fold pyridoxal phosphate-dependent enzyme [Duncaniella sp.]
LLKRASHPVYGYATVPDEYWNSIISWLGRRHGWKVTREMLTFTPGVVRGIGYIINFFTRPGDRIVIQPPVYHPFRRLIDGNGRVTVENPLVCDADDNYTMDIEGLEKIFAEEHPAMMILCNPHNPIGLQWSRETLAEVARLALKYGVKVVSDEIHGDLMLHGRKHYPYLDSCDEARKTGIALGAPSKTFNIPGLSSSWIVIADEELRREFYEWMEVNEFGEPTMMAVVGTIAAYTHAEDWLDEALKYVEANIVAVQDYCRENLPGIRAVTPEASFLVWLDCRGLGLDHDGLIDLFVNRARLALNDVYYKQLTLPTNSRVLISLVAVSIKKRGGGGG